MPSHRDTASAATGFMPGRDRAMPGAAAHGGGRVCTGSCAAWLHPGLESCFFPWGFPVRSVPLAIMSCSRSTASPLPPCLLTKACPCIPPADGYSQGCSPVQIRGLVWEGHSGHHVSRGASAWADRAGKDHGSRRVRVLWGSPAPFPPHSRVLLAGLVTTTSVLRNLSPPHPWAAWGAVGQGLSAGWMPPSPPLPAGSDQRCLAYPSAQPGKILPQGDAVPPQPEWQEPFHSKLLPCTLPHPGRSLWLYE